MLSTNVTTVGLTTQCTPATEGKKKQQIFVCLVGQIHELELAGVEGSLYLLLWPFSLFLDTQ